MMFPRSCNKDAATNSEISKSQPTNIHSPDPPFPVPLLIHWGGWGGGGTVLGHFSTLDAFQNLIKIAKWPPVQPLIQPLQDILTEAGGDVAERGCGQISKVTYKCSLFTAPPRWNLTPTPDQPGPHLCDVMAKWLPNQMRQRFHRTLQGTVLFSDDTGVYCTSQRKARRVRMG